MLAVVGGQLNLFGMPGGASTPSWVRLAETTTVNATAIAVNADVSGWPVGSRVSACDSDVLPHKLDSKYIRPEEGPAVNLTAVFVMLMLTAGVFAPKVRPLHIRR